MARKIFAVFYNKRVGLILILLVGFLSLLGVLFAQAPAGVRADPVTYSAWLDTVRPRYGGWTNILSAVGIFHMFSSVVFIVAMTLLSLSILACTFHRLPQMIQQSTRPHTKVTESFFERARLNDSFELAMQPAAALESVKIEMGRRRARILEDDRGPGLNLYADRHRFAPFGTVAAHIAFVIVIVGALVTSMTGFSDDDFTLSVGYPAQVGHETGLIAEARSFQDSYYPDGTPSDYVTDLVLTKDGEQVAQQEVRVNSPLTYEGVRFHQATFGISAVLSVRDGAGQQVFHDGIPLQWTTADKTQTYGKVTLDAEDLLIYVVSAASGQRSGPISAGQVRVEVYPGQSDNPIAAEILDQGQSTRIAGLDFSFEREVQYTGLLVKRDPGSVIVWIGCVLITVGMCLTMFFRHHRIWVRVTPTEDGSRVQLASPDRRDSAFSRRFRDIGRLLRETDKESLERTQ